MANPEQPERLGARAPRTGGTAAEQKLGRLEVRLRRELDVIDEDVASASTGSTAATVAAIATISSVPTIAGSAPAIAKASIDRFSALSAVASVAAALTSLSAAAGLASKIDVWEAGLMSVSARRAVWLARELLEVHEHVRGGLAALSPFSIRAVVAVAAVGALKRSASAVVRQIGLALLSLGFGIYGIRSCRRRTT